MIQNLKYFLLLNSMKDNKVLVFISQHAMVCTAGKIKNTILQPCSIHNVVLIDVVKWFLLTITMYMCVLELSGFCLLCM